MAAILCADVIFTQSRAALLALVFGLATFWFSIPLRAKMITLVIFLLFSPLIKKAILSTEGFNERIEKTVQGEDKGADRIPIWIGGLQMFKEHFFTGVGQQNFQYLIKAYCIRLGLEHHFRRLGDAHNQYLLVAAETGIFGLAAYLLAILFHFMDIRHLKKAWKNDEFYNRYLPFISGIQAGTISFMVAMMFHSHPIEEHFYWLLVIPGLMLNVYKHQKMTTSRSSTYRRI